MSINARMVVGYSKELYANVTTEIDKIQQLKPGMEVLVEISSGKARSLSANALSHVWYSDIAKVWHDSAGYAKAYCKLHYGVLILRAESEAFRNLYDKGIKNTLSYPEKLEAMKILPVTRLMDKDQMCRYLKAVQEGMAAAEMSVVLSTPEESEYDKWQQEQNK